MKRSMFVAVLLVAVAGAVSAGIVLAQLGDTQTASGTVNATSTSADLYICEPDSTPGPACGSDDNGADEAVFETVEDLFPGEVAQWPIRLKNVGAEDWIVSEVSMAAVELVDPGADCPNDAISFLATFILGKDGDANNDNPGDNSFPRFPGVNRNIKVAAGDYEDVVIKFRFKGTETENCDGNEWTVSWVFTVVPTIF